MEEHDTAAPPPPATDPHEPKVRMELQTVHGELRFVPVPDHDGWIPLVPGCAMPEDGEDVLVTVEDADGEPLVLQASYYNRAFLTPGCREFVGGNGAFEDHDEPDSRLTAWRPAPAAYRGGK